MAASILVTDATVVDSLGGQQGRLGFGREVGQAVGWILIWVAGWLSDGLCCLGRAGGLERAGFKGVAAGMEGDGLDGAAMRVWRGCRVVRWVWSEMKVVGACVGSRLGVALFGDVFYTVSRG